MTADDASRIVIGAAMRVHSALGPGLLESAYEVCLAQELDKAGLRYARQLEVPVIYDGMRLDCGYRLDLLVENCLIVEIKAVDALTDIHKAQVLTYLKLSGKTLALLINFNTTSLRNGIKRVVLNHPQTTLRPSRP